MGNFGKRMLLFFSIDCRIGYLLVYLESFVKENTMFILVCLLVLPSVPVCIILHLGLCYVHQGARRSHDGVS